MTRSRHLSDAERSHLIARYREGATPKELAAAFGVSISTVRYHTINVVRPAEAAERERTLLVELARHAPAARSVVLPTVEGATDLVNAAPRRFTILSPVQRARLRKRWRNGATTEALAAAFGVSAATIADLLTGVARSSQGVQREQARRAARARAKQGYPRLHAGASAVRVTPVRGGGCELRISRELYRQLGAPERLDVARYGSRVILRPGTRYSVVNRGPSGMPRITMGAPMRAALRLQEEGQFPARYAAQRHPHITVQLTPTIGGQQVAVEANEQDR